MYRVLVVLTDDSRIVSKFFKKIDAEVFERLLKETLHHRMIKSIHRVNAHRAKDRPNESNPPGQLWCPFCASFRTFRTHSNHRRCEICWISDQEFEVRRTNGLLSVPKEIVLGRNFKLKEITIAQSIPLRQPNVAVRSSQDPRPKRRKKGSSSSR